MNKTIKSLAKPVIGLALLSSGYIFLQRDEPEKVEVVETAEPSQEATIIIKANEEVVETVVEFNEEMTLLEVMQDNLDMELEDGFVTSIEGHAQSAEDNVWWVYTINEEMVTVGAEEYILLEDDIVEWELTQF